MQKLISQADNQNDTPRRSDKKIPKKKIANPTRPSRVDTSVSIFYIFSSFSVKHFLIYLEIVKKGAFLILNFLFQQHILQTIESAGIKFPDYKNSGVSLRSQRMKLPANIGQKKSKGVEQILQDMGLGKYFMF